MADGAVVCLVRGALVMADGAVVCLVRGALVMADGAVVCLVRGALVMADGQLAVREKVEQIARSIDYVMDVVTHLHRSIPGESDTCAGKLR